MRIDSFNKFPDYTQRFKQGWVCISKGGGQGRSDWGGVGGVTPPNEHNRYISGKFTKCIDRKSGKLGPPEIT